MLRTGEPKATICVALSMASATARRIVLWTLSLLFTAMFLLSGSGKLANAEGSTPAGDWDAQFEAWGYPAWARWIVGATEVLAAVAVTVPRTRFYGAAVLAATMAGAVLTHLANAEWLGTLVPVALGALAALVAWMGKPAWVAARLGRRGVTA